MNRHYKADEYKLLCDKLRSHFPDCTITTDIMVGFVGENEEDFNETLDFVKQIQFEKVHVFPYSRRKGTAADKMSGHLENSIKADRAHRLSTIADSIRQNYLKGQEGKTMNVLTEAKGKDGFSFGYSDNYTPVIFKADAKVGEIVKIKITGVKDDSCIGVICR